MTKLNKPAGISRREALKLTAGYGVTIASASLGFLNAGTTFAKAAAEEAAKKESAEHVLTMALDGTLNLHPDRPIVPDSFWIHGTRTFKSHIEEKSGGKIYVDLHDAGTLGSQTAALKKVQQGIVQGASCSTQNAAQLVPVWNALDVPYALGDAENSWNLLYSSEFNEALRKPSAQARLELLYTTPYTRWVMIAKTVGREVRRPEDMAGVKIRVTGSKMEQVAMDILPCSPTPIAWAELLTALKDGAVDAIHHTPTSSLDGGLAPMLATIIDTSWMPHWDAIWVSSPWVNQLPEDLQQVVRDGGYLAQVEIHDTYKPLNTTVIGIEPDSPDVGWKKAGAKIVKLSDEERAAWRDALSVENNGDILNPLIDRFGREAYETVKTVAREGSSEQRRWWN